MSAARTEYLRFNIFHRFIHVLVMISFAGSALSGMALKFRTTAWAKIAMQLMGGVPGGAWLHRACATLIAFYCLLHLIFIIYYLVRRKGPILGGSSMIPRAQDFIDLWLHFLYFIGRRPKPRFDRFTYWQKFDYWVVVWAVLIMGLSGFVLWFPELATRLLPGMVLNIAQIIHSNQAVLAVGFIFLVHMFNTHLRPEKFPGDMSIFTGKVTQEDLEREHALEWERMKEDPSLMQRARVK